MLDTPEWFSPIPEGCDVPGWLPYLTAVELGLARPKLTIDFETGEVHVTFPNLLAAATGADEMQFLSERSTKVKGEAAARPEVPDGRQPASGAR